MRRRTRQRAMGALMPMMAMGPEAMVVAGGVFKFALSPYRVGRELEGLIDDFTDQGPQIAERLQAQSGQDDGLAEAQKALADAEMVKAQAAMEGVKAKSAQNQAENERKIGELQSKVAKEQQDGQMQVGQLQLSMGKQQQDFAAKMAETEAKIDKMRAETAAILQSIGLDARKQDLEEYKAAENTQAKRVDQAMSVQDRQRQAVDGERSNARAERQQQFTEQKTEQDRELQREAMKGNPNGRD